MLNGIVRTTTIVFGLTVGATLASGQAVTFADLEGLVVEVSAVQQQRIKRDNQFRSRERITSGQVKIGPGENITTTFTNTDVRNGHSRVGDRRTGRFMLGQQRKTGFDDDVVWQFSDNNLVRLRAFGEGGAGGHRMIIAFQRGPNGIQCSVSMNFATEEGKETIQTRSRLDDAKVEILESKQVSSNCRVVK